MNKIPEKYHTIRKIGGKKMEDLIKELNCYLANLNVFYRKLQNYHWNIKGEHFFVWHEKLEQCYQTINEQIDEIAEHILMIEGQPLGRMADYLKETKIKEAENKKVDHRTVLEQILEDYKILLEDTKNIKKLAEKQESYTTSNLVDEYRGQYEKILWMLTQSAR